MGEISYIYVSQQVTWFVLDEGLSGAMVSSILRWEARDPLAMTIEFLSEVDVTWKFAFELFADVLEDKTYCAGEGDVRVAKTEASDGQHLVLKLSSPFGNITLSSAVFNPLAFVNAVNETSVLSEEYDIDDALTKLLNGNYE